MNNFLNQQLCIFFPPIDSSHYSFHKSIKVQLTKNLTFNKKLIIYELFNILCQYIPE